MRLARITVAACIATLGSTLVAGGTGVAATASPTVSFHFANNRITAGRAPTVVYTSAGLPSAARLVLQTWSPSAGAWQRVRRLPVPSGRVKAPAVSMGRYRYRVVAKQAGRRLAVSPRRYLWAYGPVPLATLCASPKVTVGARSECRAGLGSAQVGDRLFAYQALLHADPSAPTDPELAAASSTCRRLHLQIAVDPAQDPTGTAQMTLSFHQQGSDVIANYLATSTKVSQMDAGLLPAAPWTIQAQAPASPARDLNVLVAGTASCWSPTAY